MNFLTNNITYLILIGIIIYQYVIHYNLKGKVNTLFKNKVVLRLYKNFPKSFPIGTIVIIPNEDVWKNSRNMSSDNYTYEGKTLRDNYISFKIREDFYKSNEYLSIMSTPKGDPIINRIEVNYSNFDDYTT